MQLQCSDVNGDLSTLEIQRNCLRNKKLNIWGQYFLLWGPKGDSTGKKLQESESGIEFWIKNGVSLGFAMSLLLSGSR
jgi:hypothetical protein